MRMYLPDKLYDALKWVAIMVIPASGTAYLALSEVWGLAYGNEVAQTCMIASTLLGVLLGISSASYYRAASKGMAGERVEELAAASSGASQGRGEGTDG